MHIYTNTSTVEPGNTQDNTPEWDDFSNLGFLEIAGKAKTLRDAKSSATYFYLRPAFYFYEPPVFWRRSALKFVHSKNVLSLSPENAVQRKDLGEKPRSF